MYMLSRPFAPLFSDTWMREAPRRSPLPAMRVDVRQSEGGYVLKADLPGVEKENLHIHVEDNRLTISADLNSEKQEDQNGYLYSERRFGHVERSFQLDGIDRSAITASYRDGVLTLQLPREAREETANRFEIAIDNGESGLAQ